MLWLGLGVPMAGTTEDRCLPVARVRFVDVVEREGCHRQLAASGSAQG
jgi:hypothetical protein